MLYVRRFVIIVQVYHNTLSVEVGGGGGRVWWELFLVGRLGHGRQFVLQVPVAQLHVALFKQF